MTNPLEQEQLLGSIASTDVVRRFFVQLQQMPEIMIDLRNTLRVWAAGQAPINTVLGEGWNAALMNVQAGLKEFAAGVGESTAGDIVPSLNDLASALRGLGRWAREHPDTTAVLLGLGAAIGALGLAGATFAAGSLALGGLTAMGTGILAMGAAITPVGWALILAAIAGGLVHLASTMEGKDWRALFGSVASGISGLWDAAKAKFGLGSGVGGTETGRGADPNTTGFEAGSGMPNLVPMEMPPAPPGRPSLSGTMEENPNLGTTGGFMEDHSSYMPPGGRAVNVATAVYLDGRQIADVVSRHQGRDAGAPVTAPNRYDTRRGGWPADAMSGIG